MIVDGKDRSAILRALAYGDGVLEFEQDCIVEDGIPDYRPEEERQARIIEIPSDYEIRSKYADKPCRISRAEGSTYQAIFAPVGFDTHNSPTIERVRVRNLILDGGVDGRRDWPADPAGVYPYDPTVEHRHLFLVFGMQDVIMENVTVDHPVSDGICVCAVWGGWRGYAVAKHVPGNLHFKLKGIGSRKNRNFITITEADSFEYYMDSDGSSRPDMPASDDLEPDNVGDREGFPYQGYIERVANGKIRGVYRNNKSNIALCAQFPNTMIENIDIDIVSDRIGDPEHYGLHGGDPTAPIQWIEDLDHSIRNTGRIKNITIKQTVYSAPVIPTPEPTPMPTEIKTPTEAPLPLPLPEILKPTGHRGCVIPLLIFGASAIGTLMLVLQAII